MSMTTNERLYWRASGKRLYPSAHAMRQFRDFESRGALPEYQSSVFNGLRSGKAGMNMARTEMRAGWLAGDDRWPGMATLESESPEWRRFMLGGWHPSEGAS
tara:strand:+ start:147 stop:452 length:306 start_codon:yes stop_codon:yes gene_type:complete